LRYLNSKQDPISLEQFNNWRQHPCTRELKKELLLAFLDQIDTDLPESIDKSIPLLHQREGARKAVGILFDWEPESIRAMREEGKEVELEY